MAISKRFNIRFIRPKRLSKIVLVPPKDESRFNLWKIEYFDRLDCWLGSENLTITAERGSSGTIEKNYSIVHTSYGPYHPEILGIGGNRIKSKGILEMINSNNGTGFKKAKAMQEGLARDYADQRAKQFRIDLTEI